MPKKKKEIPPLIGEQKAKKPKPLFREQRRPLLKYPKGEKPLYTGLSGQWR